MGILVVDSHGVVRDYWLCFFCEMGSQTLSRHRALVWPARFRCCHSERSTPKFFSRTRRADATASTLLCRPHCKESDLFEIGRSHLGNPRVVVGSEARFLLQGMNLALHLRHLLVRSEE